MNLKIVHIEDRGSKALWSKLLFLANIFILKLRARILAMAMNAKHQAAAWFVLIDYLYPLNIIHSPIFVSFIQYPKCIVLCCCLSERASFPMGDNSNGTFHLSIVQCGPFMAPLKKFFKSDVHAHVSHQKSSSTMSIRRMCCVLSLLFLSRLVFIAPQIQWSNELHLIQDCCVRCVIHPNDCNVV